MATESVAMLGAPLIGLTRLQCHQHSAASTPQHPTLGFGLFSQPGKCKKVAHWAFQLFTLLSCVTGGTEGSQLHSAWNLFGQSVHTAAGESPVSIISPANWNANNQSDCLFGVKNILIKLVVRSLIIYHYELTKHNTGLGWDPVARGDKEEDSAASGVMSAAAAACLLCCQPFSPI